MLLVFSKLKKLSFSLLLLILILRPAKAIAADISPENYLTIEQVQTATLASLLPGAGFMLLDDKISALLSFASVVVPLSLTAASVPPMIFSDLPEQKIPLWALTAQTTWSLQIHQTYQEARLRAAPDLYQSRPKIYNTLELIASPFEWDQLFDKSVWLSVFSGLASGAVLDLVFPDAQATQPNPPSIFQAQAANYMGQVLTPAQAFGINTAAATVLSAHAGIGEEVLFRGVLQEELEVKLGTIPALIGTSAAFGAVHIGGINQGNQFKVFLGTGIGGFIDGSLYLYSDRDLKKNIAAHTYYDIVAFSLAMLYPTVKGNNILGIQYRF
jgi:membrane protease YdiL (CAAX protease family)